MWQLWLLMSLLCLILELTNGDLYVLCFAIGAVATALVSLFTDSLVAQIIVFSVFSLLSIVFIRPQALRWLHREDKQRLSNADALMGRIGTVSQDIQAGDYGRVAIDGDDWKACSTSPTTIEKGRKVRVVARESIILTVEPADN